MEAQTVIGAVTNLKEALATIEAHADGIDLDLDENPSGDYQAWREQIVVWTGHVLAHARSVNEHNDAEQLLRRLVADAPAWPALPVTIRHEEWLERSVMLDKIEALHAVTKEMLAHFVVEVDGLAEACSFLRDKGYGS
jgi:hypothetical protein